MRHPRAVLLTVSAVLATSLGAAALSARAEPGTTAPAASMAPKLLAGDVVHDVSGLLSSGAHTATPAATPLTLGVSVADPSPAAIQAFITATGDPKSPDYKHFLTPGEFAARFGPTPTTISAVTGWLRSGGLTVHDQPGTYGYLTATGTVGQIGSLMKTSFATMTGSGLIANTTAPTVPAAVLGVAGLNTGTHPTPAKDPVHKISTRADSPPTGLLSPMDLWDIYDQPAVDEGQGQGLALFGIGTLDDGKGHTIEADLRSFEKEYGFPQMPYYSSYFSSSPTEKATETDGFDEWTLDAQAAAGMAPKAAKLVDYFATLGTDPDIIGSYAQWANDPTGPLQGSTSYGDCEDSPGGSLVYNTSPANSVLYLGNPAQDQYAAVYAQAAAEGRTLFAASGDTQACPTVAVALNGATPVPVPIQDYPGVDTNVVGVGGTVIYFNGETASTPASRITEYPWTYSGGGQSHFITAPAPQATAIQPVTTAGTADPVGVTPVDPFLNATDHNGTPYATPRPARIQPDVAALSGDVTGDGYTIYDAGAADSFGAGTSLSSPLWLGIWARVQAAAPASPSGGFRGVGFALPVIYKLATGGSYLKNYYDDGSASETPPSVANSNGGVGTSPAEGGYDTQTGWGSPIVSSFITSATGSTTFTPTNPSGGGGVPAADAPPAPAGGASASASASASPAPTSSPVVRTAPPAPVTNCPVRASAVSVSGPNRVVLGRFRSQLYTFKLTVSKGACKTPGTVGRQLAVYVNGRKAGVIRTGRGGIQRYLVRLGPGTQKITVAFLGNRDLKKSASKPLTARVAV